VDARWHYTLSDFGVRKRYHTDFSPEDADEVIARVVRDVDEEKEFHTEDTENTEMNAMAK
jgi:uncharacterized metal-binding protein